MVRFELIKKLDSALQADGEGALMCPCCKESCFVHPKYVGVADGGDMEKLGFSNEIGNELTHRERDKLVTMFECEMCDPWIVRVEVNHKGILFSGVYLVKDNEAYEEDLPEGPIMAYPDIENMMHISG